MIKYDDIISTLTLVNILAKDVDYGNVKNIKQGAIENSNSFIASGHTSIMKTYYKLNTIFYNFVICKICDTTINFYDFIAIKFKALYSSFHLQNINFNYNLFNRKEILSKRKKEYLRTKNP